MPSQCQRCKLPPHLWNQGWMLPRHDALSSCSEMSKTPSHLCTPLLALSYSKCEGTFIHSPTPPPIPVMFTVTMYPHTLCHLSEPKVDGDWACFLSVPKILLLNTRLWCVCQKMADLSIYLGYIYIYIVSLLVLLVFTFWDPVIYQ